MRLTPSSLRATALACALAALPFAALAQEPTRKAYDVITALGCVQKEADYRKSITDGKGGALGTGAGAANEFVLRSVHVVSPDTLRPTATSGTSFEDVYSVTGNLEKEMTRAVGRQVAVSGYVEVAKTEGTDKVKDLPRMNVVGWHVVSDRCTTP